MLKKRLILLMTLYEGVLTRTKHFQADYRYTANFVDLQSLDELVILDITPHANREFFDAVEKIAGEYNGPLTLGGGVHSVSHAKKLMRSFPCEKVVVKGNRETVVNDIAQCLGSQAVVASYDTREKQMKLPKDAGEILLQSVERDGSLKGYDLSMLSTVKYLIDQPIIIGSGCGNWKHMQEAFAAGADACATNNIFHYPESAVKAFKGALIKNGVEMRP